MLLSRWRQARLVLPLLLALAALAALIGLGNWQMARKAWKEGLLAQIAARASAQPMPLSMALQRWQETGDIEYSHVRVTGRFWHDRERHVFTTDDKLGPGFHLYTPLETPEKQIVLVNRGFVPAHLKDASGPAVSRPSGEVTVTGLARRPLPRGWFVPESEPGRNLFYWPDYPSLVASALEGRGGELHRVPFFIDADADPANPGNLPKGGATRLALPNRHLEYALTWYGLALTLVGVFAAFAHGRLRRGAGTG